MISRIHRCIFVHIPRCGGTSIEQMLWPEPREASDLWMGFASAYRNKYQTGGLQHLRASQIRHEVGFGVFESYYKFAVVRDPWDKAVSQFRHLQRRPDLRAFIGMREDDDFATYLRLIARKRHVQWEPQVGFVLDEHGALLVDELARFEHFRDDVTRIFRRLGVDADVPHLNASAREPLERSYDEECLNLVETMYREDIASFDYRRPALTSAQNV